jgi:hypothetical protein
VGTTRQLYKLICNQPLTELNLWNWYLIAPTVIYFVMSCEDITKINSTQRKSSDKMTTVDRVIGMLDVHCSYCISPVLLWITDVLTGRTSAERGTHFCHGRRCKLAWRLRQSPTCQIFTPYQSSWLPRKTYILQKVYIILQLTDDMTIIKTCLHVLCKIKTLT